MSAAKGNILVIRGGAIGDFILTLPVLAALRAQFPNARLVVLGYPHIVQLALAGGLADKAVSIESRPLAGFFARQGNLDPALSKLFAEFNLILSYLYDPDLIFQENVGRSSKAQFIAGPHRPSDQGATHATEVFLQPLERLAIFEADPEPKIRLRVPGGITGGDPSEISNLKSQIAVHPGSGSERKNWPEEHWKVFLEQLIRETDLRILLAGGEAEGGRLQRLRADLPAERVDLAQGLPLVDLACCLNHCAAYVGHDSGISHLAAALGLPSLILWGETNAQVWRPRSERVRLLHASEGLARLKAQKVRAAFEEELIPLMAAQDR